MWGLVVVDRVYGSGVFWAVIIFFWCIISAGQPRRGVLRMGACLFVFFLFFFS